MIFAKKGEKMNFWEAYQQIKKGKIIRSNVNDVFEFYCENHSLPIKDSILIKVPRFQASLDEEMPLNTSDLEFDEVDDICVDALENLEFKEVSEEEMMKEIQEYWKSRKKNNEE